MCVRYETVNERAFVSTAPTEFTLTWSGHAAPSIANWTLENCDRDVQRRDASRTPRSVSARDAIREIERVSWIADVNQLTENLTRYTRSESGSVRSSKSSLARERDLIQRYRAIDEFQGETSFLWLPSVYFRGKCLSRSANFGEVA